MRRSSNCYAAVLLLATLSLSSFAWAQHPEGKREITA
jgi:hypothetical protein